METIKSGSLPNRLKGFLFNYVTNLFLNGSYTSSNILECEISHFELE